MPLLPWQRSQTLVPVTFWGKQNGILGRPDRLAPYPGETEAGEGGVQGSNATQSEGLGRLHRPVLFLSRRFQPHMQYAVPKQWKQYHASSPLFPDHHCLHLSNNSTFSLLTKVSPSSSGGSNTHQTVASGADHGFSELSCSGLLPPEGSSMKSEVLTLLFPPVALAPGLWLTLKPYVLTATNSKKKKNH